MEFEVGGELSNQRRVVRERCAGRTQLCLARMKVSRVYSEDDK